MRRTQPQMEWEVRLRAVSYGDKGTQPHPCKLPPPLTLPRLPPSPRRARSMFEGWWVVCEAFVAVQQCSLRGIPGHGVVICTAS